MAQKEAEFELNVWKTSLEYMQFYDYVLTFIVATETGSFRQHIPQAGDLHKMPRCSVSAIMCTMTFSMLTKFSIPEALNMLL